MRGWQRLSLIDLGQATASGVECPLRASLLPGRHRLATGKVSPDWPFRATCSNRRDVAGSGRSAPLRAERLLVSPAAHDCIPTVGDGVAYLASSTERLELSGSTTEDGLANAVPLWNCPGATVLGDKGRCKTSV